MMSLFGNCLSMLTCSISQFRSAGTLTRNVKNLPGSLGLLMLVTVFTTITALCQEIISAIHKTLRPGSSRNRAAS